MTSILVNPEHRNGNSLMWTAVYRNNSVVLQYDGRGNHRSFADLPRKDLKRVTLTSIDTGRLIAAQNFMPGMSPFYRQRNLMGQNNIQHAKVHILGWAIWDGKKTVSNLHVAFINEATFEVEMGHFVEGRNAGFKYPIKIEEYDYPPIVWE